jgi:hypothetical protein
VAVAAEAAILCWSLTQTSLCAVGTGEKKKEKLLLCLLQLGFVERSENCDKKIDTAT